MDDAKVQWHPGFVAAISLEFANNRDGLIFEKEYNLNTKPLEIDLLVIKKEASVRISNEIGAFFKGHNVMEYKSPKDHLDIDAFYKATAYASLYKSYGQTLDEIKADDVTVSLIRETKPEGLFRYFGEHGYPLENPHKGIYYVKGNVLFPTQIVVTEELDKADHIWLGSLSEKMGKQDMKDLLEKIRRLSKKSDRELADSVLEVSVGANKEVLESLKGDDGMCQALMEIMEPEISIKVKEREKEALQRGMQQGMQRGMQQGIQQGVQQGIQQGVRQGIQQGVQQGIQQGVQRGIRQGIQGAVEMLQKFGRGEAEIKAAIMEEYGLSAEEAEGYFQ